MATVKEMVDGIFTGNSAHTCKENPCSHTNTLNLGTSLAKFIAQDSTNKLDSREQTINGSEIENFFSKEILMSLAKSKFKRLRKRLGKQLSLKGQAALVIDIIDDAPFIALSEIANYVRVAGVLQEYWGDTGRVYEEENASFPIYERWYLEDGLVKKYFGFQKDGEWIAENQPFVYPANITVIPVQIFDNNEDAKSDIDNVDMWDAIKELDYHGGQLRAEWDMIKTAFVRNAMFGAGKDAKQFQKEKANGGIIDATSPDGQLGNVLAPLISGSQTALINQANINFIEDKILKYTFTTRDSTGTGTNKHNAEIATFNQFAIEYLTDKKEIRQEDYAHFYALLKMFDGGIFNPMDITVELKVSEIVENLVKASNPDQPEVQERINKDETKTETTEEVK